MTEGILTAYKFRHLDGGPRVLAIQNHGWIQVGWGLFQFLAWGRVLWAQTEQLGVAAHALCAVGTRFSSFLPRT